MSCVRRGKLGGELSPQKEQCIKLILPMQSAASTEFPQPFTQPRRSTRALQRYAFAAMLRVISGRWETEIGE